MAEDRVASLRLLIQANAVAKNGRPISAAEYKSDEHIAPARPASPEAIA